MFKSRNKNVFFAALSSIFVGAIVLNLSENSVQTANAFSLSGYNMLNSVKNEVSSYGDDSIGSWDRIETKSIVISSDALTVDAYMSYNAEEYHFIICNGFVGDDGQIISTENWHAQLPVLTSQPFASDNNTIRIGIIISKSNVSPSEAQLKRSNILASLLARRFDIPPVSIFMPFF